MSDLQPFPNTGPTELVWELARAFKQFAAQPALTVGAQCWTFADLWQNAASIAVSLASCNRPVALIGSRSIEDYAAVLAIFISGRCYVPLNEHAPGKELRALLKLTQASTLLSARETPTFSSLRQSRPFDARLIDISQPTRAMPPPQLSKFAYIIATSGSSGAPKAVPISHRNLLSYLANARRHLDITPRDRTSQIFDLSFDLSLHDIFMTWLNGAH
ncbi:MAG: AMP-binding protein, partial [Rhodobacteraceae bacterium]|nr:AMP-binding protein [Paracoccaceae bacterium]